MFLLGWSVRALPLRKAPLGALSRAILLIVLALLGAAGSAHGGPGKRADKTGEVDTEHMFGFTEGSDIGEAGETELEADSTGRFGKLGGAYNNVATALEAKYSFSEWFRLSVDATVAYYNIAGVDGLDDRRQGALQSVSFDARFRLFDREHAPFGLTPRRSAQPSSLRRARPQRFRGAGVLHRPDLLRDLRRTILCLGGVERSGLGRGGGNFRRARSR
jgi:hypothetical protein